jgi:glycosyltransferase involved in cell wall biosynthesis
MKLRLFLLADGGNPHTIKWAKSLAKDGADIFIFGLSEFDPKLYQEFPNIECYSLNFQSELYRQSEGEWIKLKYLKALPLLKKYLKKFQPQILHAHYASSYGFLGALTGFHPYILSVWGADVYDFPVRSYFHELVLRFNLSKADKILSTSHVMAIQTKKFTNKTIEVTPFGIDLAKFNVMEKKINLFPKDSIVIGTVKTLEDKYGIQYLVEAFAIVKQSYPKLPLKLLIVGRGSKELELKNLAKKLNIEEETHFTGWVNVEEVPQYHNLLDIAVFPSVLDSESFGVAVIEAAACQKPVIVSNKGGLIEVVENGKTGIVVPAKNPNKLANAIEYFLENSEARDLMGRSARDRVQKMYDWKDNLKLMQNIYNQVLKEFKTV